MDQPQSVHVPDRIIETVNRVVRTSRQLFVEIGREPTVEELAEKLAMPPERVARLLEIARTPVG